MTGPWYLLPLAADTADGLAAATAELRSRLAAPGATIADAAARLQRAAWPGRFRCYLIGRDIAEVLAAIDRPHRDSGMTAQADHGRSRPVVFMFPGGGAQHPGMAAGLYAGDEVFRRSADRCAGLFRRGLGLDVRVLLGPAHRADAEDLRLQLASLFTVEYSLARFWLSLGVRPAALIGHSLGEYVAATIAQRISLPDAAVLISVRAKLLASLPPGAMLGIHASESEVAPLIEDGLSVAAVNGPRRCVVSGSSGSVAELAVRLAAAGIRSQPLHVHGAGHSALVDGVLEQFGAVAAGLRSRPAALPSISNVSGTWLTAAQAADPRYWQQHLRAPVRFADGLRTVLADYPDAVLLEVGPGTSLSTLARQNDAAARVVSSLPHPLDPRPDAAVVTGAAGQLWLAGADIDWPSVSSRRQAG